MTMKIRVVFMVMLLFGAFYFTFFHDENEKKAADREVNSEEETSVYPTSAHTVKVVLERVYLDGEISEETVEETIWSMEDFWASYEDWKLITMNEEEIVFQQHVNDISPLLKTNGYFGISDKGVLSIFNGKPDQSKIIQSFFQIDVNKLESKQHKELVKGIPIKNKKSYEDVLKSFEQYSIPK
ncbi:BofC C-terminal domain-containing protein [Bacillus seohaeanensis]|jgi:forespore regulator of the sigma-K checkpoint|uniref:BofC C-terminal domain-containing protein n=1 Tax=Bacillus seohaeanensis TaxID=284580 RepID=A0ABW5RT14_9BACI